MDPLIDQVRQTLREFSMVLPGSRVLVGFSGGPDSTALVRALMILAPELDICLGLAHLNHRLRGAESDQDQAFVQAFARDHGLELALDRQDVADLARQHKRSLEEAGREARYDFFRQTAREKGYTLIALGHHWEDHTEQVLMNLIRGTGPQGLKGISPTRDGIIRPLIRITKTQILAFLKDLNQPFVTDRSNTDPAFLRNRVRCSLIPFLEQGFNPDIRSGLDRLSQIMTQEDDFLAAESEKAFNALATDQSPNAVCLSLALRHLHPALARRVLRKALEQVKQDLRRISLGHIQDMLDLAQSRASGKHLDLPGQIRVYREKNRLRIQKEDTPLRTLGRLEKG